MSVNNDAPALAKREPTISKADHDAISKAARAELRDRFAIAALTGFLGEGLDELWQKREVYAEEAYLFADAMLKARGHV